jgi:hypothetical protein
LTGRSGEVIIACGVIQTVGRELEVAALEVGPDVGVAMREARP